MSPAACSEHELIRSARDGDDRAFEELYARYRERIAAFIVNRVGDHGRAEDIAQEVFMSALRRLRASEQAIQFKPWIYEIAKNACIDEYRRSCRTREVSLDAEFEGGAPRPLLSLAPSPPLAAENRQKLADLRGAFGGLSESHHQLLVLREFEGRSYEEIGAQTGMSKQMVESALFRARRKLSEEYEELASGRRCQQVQAAIANGRASSERSLGARERRQFARHLAHCQPCRAAAHLAGVDDALVAPRRIGAKIAALLPFPLWRWPLGAGRSGRALATRVGSHATELHSLSTAAASGEPAGAAAFGGAAVAAAVLALTGAGVGVTPAKAGPQPAAPDISVIPAARLTAWDPVLYAPIGRLPALPGIASGRLVSRAPAVAGPTVVRRRAGDLASPGGRGQAANPRAAGAQGSGTSLLTAAGQPTGSAGAIAGAASHAAGTVAGAATGAARSVGRVISSIPLPRSPQVGGGAARSAAGVVTGAASSAGSTAQATAQGAVKRTGKLVGAG